MSECSPKLQVERSPPTASDTSRKPVWRNRLPFFYGWVVVASVFVTQSICYGIYYSFSVFFVALLGEFGWSRAPTAGVFSVLVLVIGLGGVVSGALIDRFGASKVLPTGAILMSLGLAAASQLSELWQFYLYFGLVFGLGFSLTGWVPCVAVLSRWFSGRLGLATGVASAGMGLGIVAMVPFSEYLIVGFGWRSAYLIIAGVALLGIAPQSAFLLVARPDESGLEPDAVSVSSISDPSGPTSHNRELLVVDQEWTSRPWSVATAIRTSRFWLLAGYMVLTPLTSQILWVHQVAYLVDGGYDKVLAAAVAGLVGLASMPAKTVWGVAGDRLGREVAHTAGAGITILAIFLLVLAKAFPALLLVLLFAVTFGIGYAVAAPLQPTVVADVFGGRNFGAIYGVLSIGVGVGSALGPWLGGYIFDATGSYLLAFELAAASIGASAACVWFASPRKIRRISRSQTCR